MRKLIMLALLGLSMTVATAVAADAVAVKSPTTAAVTAKTKTLAEKGRFHTIHDKKEKLDCNDCHGGGADDILFLRTGEFQGKDGPVDRKECLVCHQAPKKPTFYGTPK